MRKSIYYAKKHVFNKWIVQQEIDIIRKNQSKKAQKML